MAAKTRDRDLVIDSYQIARFYQARLPDDVCDRARLEKLDQSNAAGALRMRREDLVDADTESITPEAFPDHLEVGSSRLPLEYRFEPGARRDGVNLKIHQAALAQISDDRLDWLVPGLLHDKLVAMIKSLPKRIRRNLVPAADVARQITAELQPQYGTVPFMTAVTAAMSRHAEMPVTADDFQFQKIADNLRIWVTVVDDEGQTVVEGRALEQLRSKAGAAIAAPVEDQSDQSWSRQSMKTFDMDQLPREVIRTRGGVQVAQYPGLIDLGNSVSTSLFPDQASADASLRQGAMRLYALTQRSELRSQVRWLPCLEAAKIKLSGVVAASQIESALIDLLARIAFVEAEDVIRSRDQFESRRVDRGERIARAAQEIAGWLADLADHYFAVRRSLESIDRSGRFAEVINDIGRQLDWLLCEQFLSITPWQWLRHYPRYLAAIDYRVDKLRSGAATRDHELMQSVAQLWQRWMTNLLESDRTPARQAASEFRWLIEELRVSLFAQPLGTSVKISIKRCEKLL